MHRDSGWVATLHCIATLRLPQCLAWCLNLAVSTPAPDMQRAQRTSCLAPIAVHIHNALSRLSAYLPLTRSALNTCCCFPLRLQLQQQLALALC